jgi:hypothetical protein
MSNLARRGFAAGASALIGGLLMAGIASAQEVPPAPSATAGLIVGMVARCVAGAEQPAVGASVGYEGGPSALARTDSAGEFVMALPPGQYTILANAEDGSASRQYVPVEAGATVDIGVLDIGGGVAGCGPDTNTEAPPQPTVTPTPEVPTPTPTALPTATPTATPPPADEEPASGG